MADRKETRQIALVCDRGHEFTGTASYTILKPEEEPDMEQPVLGRIHDRCPECDSPHVQPPA